MARHVRPALALAMLALLLAGTPGCGSKISEANYYKVHYGMSEEDVEEVLGPAHTESTPPDAMGKVRTWSRGPLTIRVRFDHGKVVSRTVQGIASETEVPPSTQPAPATAESASAGGSADADRLLHLHKS